jgi:hypothetical protein
MKNLPMTIRCRARAAQNLNEEECPAPADRR